MDNTTMKMTEGIVLIASRIPVTLFGVLENLFVIYLYFRSSRLRNISMKVIINLAITDLVTVLTFSIHSMGFTFLRKWPMLCMGTWLVMICMNLVSQSVLGIATIERYIAICHQERYARIMTFKTLTTLLVFAWIVPLMIFLLPFFGFNYLNKHLECYYPHLLHEWIYYMYSIVNILLITITFALYMKIILNARAFYRKFRPAQVAVVNEASSRIRARQNSIRNGKSMGIITAVCIICNLPFHIFQFRFGSEFSDNPHILVIFGTFGTISALINPFLYAWQKKDFRRELGTVLKCKCFKNRTDVERPREDRFRLNNKVSTLPNKHDKSNYLQHIPTIKAGRILDENWDVENREGRKHGQTLNQNQEIEVIELMASPEDIIKNPLSSNVHPRLITKSVFPYSSPNSTSKSSSEHTDESVPGTICSYTH